MKRAQPSYTILGATSHEGVLIRSEIEIMRPAGPSSPSHFRAALEVCR